MENLTSLWELRVKTEQLSKAQENAGDVIGFIFYWSKSGASFLNQSNNEVKQNQSNSG